MKRGELQYRAMQKASARLCRGANLPITGRSSVPSIKALISTGASPGLLCRAMLIRNQTGAAKELVAPLLLPELPLLLT
jgi:hypothetical protein